MKILNIVESGYRATLEEQDDTILWLSHALQNNGATVSVLLKSDAVNYMLKGQHAAGLVFGAKASRGPDIVKDLSAMLAKGIPVYYVEEDARDRGLPVESRLEGVQSVARKDVPRLFDQFEQVWHW